LRKCIAGTGDYHLAGAGGVITKVIGALKGDSAILESSATGTTGSRCHLKVKNIPALKKLWETVIKANSMWQQDWLVPRKGGR